MLALTDNQDTVQQGVVEQPRINLYRLARNSLLSLVLPCTIAIVLDLVLGTWPFLTLIVAGIAFPISGIIVVRSTMQELNKVIEQLEPKYDRAGAVEDMSEQERK